MATIRPEDHASDEEYVQPPPGEYWVRFEEIEYRKSSTGGSRYCNAKLRVVGAEDQQYEGAIIWEVFGLSEKALFKICDASISCGSHGEWDPDYEEQTKRQLLHRVGKVQTKWEEYEGVRRTKVQRWLKTTPEEREKFSAPVPGSNKDLPDGPDLGQTQKKRRPGEGSRGDIPF